MTRTIDETGKKYGPVTVLEYSGSENGVALWKCLCECGKTFVARGKGLRSGRIRSCGCNNFVGRIKHGGFGTSEYSIWSGMIWRCYNENSPSYLNYGGRGIVMCERWRNDFSNFAEDMGERPGVEYSIDRIDNDGPYSPDNCRWATRKEQMNNRRNNRILSHNGQELTMAQWADNLDLSYDIIRDRLRKGWTVEQALSTPAMKRGRPRRTPHETPR